MVSDFKILMVCTEFPPMQGGVGRYTHNLVKSLRSNSVDVAVVSSSQGSGDYNGISPHKINNSGVLIEFSERNRTRYSSYNTSLDFTVFS